VVTKESDNIIIGHTVAARHHEFIAIQTPEEPLSEILGRLPICPRLVFISIHVRFLRDAHMNLWLNLNADTTDRHEWIMQQQSHVFERCKLALHSIALRSAAFNRAWRPVWSRPEG
jgi:hypothetical protein